MTNTESREMYLETILRLSDGGKKVRAVDIADAMEFSKPSVSRAVGLLKNSGYIAIADDGEISLTKEGKAVADRIYERHTVLTDALTRMGIQPDIAEENACRWEHVITDEAFEVIKEHVNKHAADAEQKA